MHRRFTFRQRKDILRAVFERIYVRRRGIVGVKLNPPFSLFFDQKVRGLFEDCPVGGIKQDVFEQLISFTLSGRYRAIKEAVERPYGLISHCDGAVQGMPLDLCRHWLHAPAS